MTNIDEFVNPRKKRNESFGRIAELLESNGIDIDEIGNVQRINVAEKLFKDENGKFNTTELFSFVINPDWGSGPKWPVVQPCKPVQYKASTAKVAKNDGFLTAVVLPDMQIGFYTDAHGELHATHDDAAIDVALQIIKSLKPNLIIFNGDNLDFPEMSKYRLSPAFQRTTQATIDRAGFMVAQVRHAAGPDCEIRWLEGNHEMRISNYILDNAAAAFGIKRSNSPEDWPVLSVPNLCRLDEHDVTYLPGYPANETWINDRLRVIHGTHVVSGGSTAHKYLAHERVSTVYGHIHRREWAERTRTGHDGANTILAMSAGCLARVDGKVPSTKGGMDLDGVPIPVIEDWQQGLAVFTYEEGNGRFIPEQVPIMDGWTVFRGKHYYATITE